MEKTIFIKITGRVQGIGFRWCAYEQFVELGLAGKAENARDGSVEITATGEEAHLSKLVEWCHVGPNGARISHVEVSEASPLKAEPKKTTHEEKHEKSDT